MVLTVIIIFAGAAGMYGLEKSNPGFTNYGLALWWTAMRVITAGSDFWPITPEGRVFAFILSLYGYAVFGYVTATLATFFIGQDTKDKQNYLSRTSEIEDIKRRISRLTEAIKDASYVKKE
jgi:voltage-gated potassium channel